MCARAVGIGFRNILSPKPYVHPDPDPSIRNAQFCLFGGLPSFLVSLCERGARLKARRQNFGACFVADARDAEDARDARPRVAAPSP